MDGARRRKISNTDTKEAKRNGLNHKDTKIKTGHKKLELKNQSQAPKY